jgi:3D (Asp-Asp-Asp) domain-containing protein
MVAAGGFVLAYTATMLDSRYGSLQSRFGDPSDPPSPGSRIAFTATAYCRGLVTTSGVAAQSGIAAADPMLLPVGSVVQTESAEGVYDGIYAVLDTGPLIHGRQLDIYIWNCDEAVRFGRKAITLTVLRLGWNPRATRPGLMQRLFRRPSKPLEPDPLPSRPLSLNPAIDQN